MTPACVFKTADSQCSVYSIKANNVSLSKKLNIYCLVLFEVRIQAGFLEAKITCFPKLNEYKLN